MTAVIKIKMGIYFISDIYLILISSSVENFYHTVHSFVQQKATATATNRSIITSNNIVYSAWRKKAGFYHLTP